MSELSLKSSIHLKPNQLSPNFIGNLHTTINQVCGYFQIVQLHRKRENIYSTHISDGYFKCKVIFREETSRQIDLGEIKLFSILYGRVANHGNRVFMARWKLEAWDYHKSIGLLKPWKHQRPNVNIQGNNIIKWVDDYSSKKDKNAHFLTDNKKTPIKPLCKKEQNEEKQAVDSKIKNQQKEDSFGTTQSLKDLNNLTSCKTPHRENTILEVLFNQSSQFKHQGTKTPISFSKNNKNHFKPQEEEDVFLSILGNIQGNRVTKLEQLGIKSQKKSTSYKNSKRLLLLQDSQSVEEKKVDQQIEMKKEAQKLQIEDMQESQQDYELLSKISKATKNIQKNPIKKERKSQKYKQSLSQPEDEDDDQEQIQSLMALAKKQTNQTKSKDTKILEQSKKQEQQEQQIYQLLMDIENQNKSKKNPLNQQHKQQKITQQIQRQFQQIQSIASSQQLDNLLNDLILETKTDNHESKHKEKHIKDASGFLLSDQKNICELVIGMNYEEQKWVYLKPICHSLVKQKMKTYLLYIMRTETEYIINFYLESQDKNILLQLSSNLALYFWHRISLKNVKILEPKQNQYRNEIQLYIKAQNLKYVQQEKSGKMLKDQITDFPYAPIWKIEDLPNNMEVSLYGVIKSAFSKVIKGNKVMKKLIIVDIFSGKSAELTIFNENSHVEVKDQISKITNNNLNNISSLINKPILLFNIKVSSYQNRKSLQNKPSTIIITGTEQIQQIGENSVESIAKIIRWIEEGNTVDLILNDAQKYQEISCLHDLSLTAPNFTTFYLKKCTITSVSPSFCYEACGKCMKKIFTSQTSVGNTKSCYTCGNLKESQTLYRYYISVNVSDFSSNIAAVWGHTQCKHIFNAPNQKDNIYNFEQFKSEYMHCDVSLWLNKKGGNQQKNKTGSTIYSIMKLQRIPKQEIALANLHQIKRFIQFMN